MDDLLGLYLLRPRSFLVRAVKQQAFDVESVVVERRFYRLRKCYGDLLRVVDLLLLVMLNKLHCVNKASCTFKVKARIRKHILTPRLQICLVLSD